MRPQARITMTVLALLASLPLAIPEPATAIHNDGAAAASGAVLPTDWMATGIAASPDGIHAAVGGVTGGVGGIAIYNTATRKVEWQMQGLAAGGLSPVYSPTGDRLYLSGAAAGGAGTAVIDVATRSVIGGTSGSGSSSQVAVTPDGATLVELIYVNSASPSQMRIIDAVTLQTRSTLAVGDGPGLAISPDGRYAYTVADERRFLRNMTKVLVVDLASGLVADRIDVGVLIPSSASGLLIGSDGLVVDPAHHLLYVYTESGLTAPGFALVDTQTQKLVGRLQISKINAGGMISSAFDAKSGYLYFGLSTSLSGPSNETWAVGGYVLELDTATMTERFVRWEGDYPRSMAIVNGNSELWTAVEPTKREIFADKVPFKKNLERPSFSAESVSVNATVGGAIVRWLPPLVNTARRYEVVVSPGKQKCRTAGLTCTFRGLRQGRRYKFTVQAFDLSDRTGPVVSRSVVVLRPPKPSAPPRPIAPPPVPDPGKPSQVFS